jgi:D-3-phosphoglycerate dehydrogenase
MSTSEKPKRVAVLSRSFSRHPILRAELQARYPDAKFNDAGRTLADDELAEFVAGFDGVVVALERLNAAMLARMPDLRILSKYGVGLDNVDLEAASRAGVRVGWTGGVNRKSVAELVIAMMIALLRLMPLARKEIQEGMWRQLVGRDLGGRVVGVVGCGHVGQEVIRLLGGFGCRVLAHDLRAFPQFYAEHGVTPVGLDELLRQSEVVTLHLPATAATHMLLNADKLDLMRPDAVLVNAARGGIVDEEALKQRLKDGRLAGAGLDVLMNEPPTDMELLGLNNVVVTPHIGGSTNEAILAMGRAAIEGLFNARDPLSPDYIPSWLRSA